MDSISTVEFARVLGVSLPTAHKLFDEAGVARVSRGHRRTAPRLVAESLLVRHGAAPRCERTPSEVKVLAALYRAPQGLHSAREIARHAGLSPTTVTRAMSQLVRDGLITDGEYLVAQSKKTERRIFTYLGRMSPELMAAVSATQSPAPRAG